MKKNDYVKVLKEKFKFDNFREHQLEIIKYIIEDKRDILSIMYTGFGKSLLFQFVSVYTNKIVIVISPLISLMNDQVMKMKELNIPVCTLNSTVNNKMFLKAEIYENKYRLVYMTPEYLITQQDFLQELYDRSILEAFCVDESHCLSSMGSDFRPSYLKLNCIRDWFEDVPIIAVTATATPVVSKDIVKCLGLKNPAIIKTTFDRPNLIIKLIQKTTNSTKDLLSVVEPGEPTIIYCQTRKASDSISNDLKQRGINCECYHAGMRTEDRESVHERFVKGEISCVVGTIAFGMGIDLTIRKVIHYGIPKDIEGYYQEIGRSGRDGKESHCYLFYALGDMNSNNYFLNQISNVAYRNRMIQMALVMKNYLFSSECRRKYILAYFGEEYKKDNCKACDNCLTNKQVTTKDFGSDALLIFQVMNLTGNNFGATMIINILRGSGSKKIPKFYTKSNLFNAGRHHTEQWWKILMRMLINNSYIKEKPISGGHSFTLAITQKAIDFMGLKKIKPDTQLILQVPDDMSVLLPKTKKKPELILFDDDFNDHDDHNHDNEPVISEQETEIITKKKHPMDTTYELYQNKKRTIIQIAKDLDLKKQTIEDHICKLYAKNYTMDLTPVGFTNEIYETISNKIIELKNPDKLKTIKDNLPDHISYLQIKLTQMQMKKNEKKNEKNTNKNNKPNPDDEYILVKPKKKKKIDDDDDDIIIKPEKKCYTDFNFVTNIKNTIIKQKELSNKIDEEYKNIKDKLLIK